MFKPKLYVSMDIDADGNNALVNNMLSLGMYALDSNEANIFSFYANFKPLDGHVSEKKCMVEFWGNQPEAWDKTQQNQQEHYVVMEQLSALLTQHSENYNIQFVAMPSCFDWMFFKSYYEHAKAFNPKITYDIGYQCICGSSMLKMYRQMKNMSNKQYTLFWNSLCKIDDSQLHDALYDAKVQGIQFVRLLNKINDK